MPIKASNQLKLESDEALQKITGQVFVGQAILIAHELGFFESLSLSPMNLEELANELQLHKRAIQALASCSAAMNLIEFTGSKYQLTQVGEFFLGSSGKIRYGKVLDLLVSEHSIMNYAYLKTVILTNSPQVSGNSELFDIQNETSNTQEFIDALHNKAIAAAFFWPALVCLTRASLFIDIGGASGIHTIAACLSNPNLKGVVCDRESVLKYTQPYISQYNLSDRISIKGIDMFNNTLPKGDVHFYGDIFHDWKYDKCFYLAKKSYTSLNPGGKIIIHEMLFNNEKTGPFLTAGYNMKMMAWTEGQQFSRSEIIALLEQAGFKDIEIIPSLSNWSLIIGNKPTVG